MAVNGYKEMDSNTSVFDLVITAVISGGVVSAVVGVMFKSFVTRVEAEVKSRRTWKEESVADLLGPLIMQFDRTKRAFTRWGKKNLYLEAKVVKVGNETIRDILQSPTMKTNHRTPICVYIPSALCASFFPFRSF